MPETRRKRTTFQDSFSEEIWISTYKDHNDETIDDTLYRVAKAAASVEKTKELQEEYTEKFYDLLSDFKGTAGGRIYSNAGTEWKGTTLMNCYVNPRKVNDLDSLDGILTNLRNQAQTLKSEGGWGENFSYIRPRGAFIRGIGVETPGAVKYMEMFDKSSEIITSGSGRKSLNKKAKGKIRKGAMMGVLDCWHPDIVEFITAKQQPGRLSKFNVSVNCTDEFMDKVVKILKLRNENAPQEDIDNCDRWDLRFPDTSFKKYKTQWDGDIKKWEDKGYPVQVYKTISVMWLWNMIMESTYNRAEPGVLFLDRANHFLPLSYAETAMATNPCITGDTLVATADGRHQVSIKQLAEEGKDVPVFTVDHNNNIVVRTMRHPRVTGYNQPIYKITLDDGMEIKCTGNHKFKSRSGDYLEAKELKTGDSLFVMTKYHAAFEDIFPDRNSSSQDYMWINSSAKSNKAEHRLIAEYFSGNIPKGSVVHHIDFDSLNNDPTNLKIMTKLDHDAYHGNLIKGDNNPMRKAKATWTADQWNEYKGVSSPTYNTEGENNSRYSGITTEEYFQHAVSYCKEINRRFSTGEWNSFCKKHNLPDLSNFRLSKFVTHSAFAKAAAETAGVEGLLLNLSPKTQRKYQELKEQGYSCEIKDNVLCVEKECEVCHSPFLVHSHRREVSICSTECNSEYTGKRNILNKELYHKRAKERIGELKNERRNKQLQIYSSLAFELSRPPLKKEWQKQCKDEGVACLIGPKSPFQTYSQLQECASMFNHKVVSVEVIGNEDVYNGTVDDFHNFFIGGKESTTKNGKKKWSYVNNLQCGEQVLSPGGVCNLGSLNLTQFINSDRTGFKLAKIKKYVRIMVRFLDNINDLSETPLPEYEFSMRNKRRIGCGILGWGSALFMLKVRFGSERAAELREQVMSTIAREAYMASIDLAEEKGMFSLCDPKKHAEGAFVRGLNLPSKYMDKLQKVGIRNSSLLSIQPTGNTSILANVVSGGLEPIFMPEYVRTVIVNTMPEHIADVTPKWYEGEWYTTSMFKKAKEGDEEILRGVDENGVVYKIDKNRGLTKEVLCEDYGVRYLKSIGEWDPKAEWAVTTSNMSVQSHVEDLKGFARWIDSSCSKTINVPNNYSFEDFKNIYIDAYQSGYVKGVTTYRAGTMTTVLAAKDEKDATADDEEIIKEDVKLPVSAPAVMKTIKAEGKKWYLTVVYHEDNRNRPFALFVKTNAHEKNVTADEAVDKLMALARKKRIPKRHRDAVEEKLAADNNSSKVARLISFLLRHGVLIKNIVATLDRVDEAYVGTFVYQVRKFLASYIKDGERVEDEKCVECGGNIIYSEGCFKCSNCGTSRC